MWKHTTKYLVIFPKFIENLFKTIIIGDNVAKIPKAPIKQIFKEAGANRVSDDAVNLLHSCILEYSKTIAEKSVTLSNFNNRKTVTGKDVEAVFSLE